MAVPGVTNSDGGSASRAFSMTAYANTAGFNGTGCIDGRWFGWQDGRSVRVRGARYVCRMVSAHCDG